MTGDQSSSSDRRPPPSPGLGAVVLAGGTGRRVSGADKARILIAGRPLLDRVLDAVGDVEEVVVVGEPRGAGGAVTWTREEPAGAGPVAALAEGLRHIGAERVAVLAGDLPFLGDAVARLDAALTGDADGAVLTDAAGRDQPLIGVYRAGALRSALAQLGVVQGAALRDLVGRLRLVRVPDPGDPLPAAFDCDTWADVDLARRLSSGRA